MFSPNMNLQHRHKRENGTPTPQFLRLLPPSRVGLLAPGHTRRWGPPPRTQPASVRSPAPGGVATPSHAPTRTYGRWPPCRSDPRRIARPPRSGHARGTSRSSPAHRGIAPYRESRGAGRKSGGRSQMLAGPTTPGGVPKTEAARARARVIMPVGWSAWAMGAERFRLTARIDWI